MRVHLAICFLLLSASVHSQSADTITLVDYTQVMIVSDVDGKAQPITALDKTKHAGFFLNSQPEGVIRICAEHETFLWINGRLDQTIDGCKYYDPSHFFSKEQTDTVFLALSSGESLEGLICDLVIYEELRVVKEEVAISRSIRDYFREFAACVFLIMLIILGYIYNAYPSRINYMITKSFTIKKSSYEFINTAFFSASSFYLLVFFSLMSAFVLIYLNSILDAQFFFSPEQFGEYWMTWLQLSGGVCLIMLIKWVLVSVVSKLFRFRAWDEFQLFDFLNFSTLIMLVSTLIIAVDFIFFNASNPLVGSSVLIIFPISFLIFIFWFTFKFVSNSPRKKLVIFSYLCATEIIPVVLLTGLFFK